MLFGSEGDDFQVGYGSEVTETKKLNLSIEISHPENRPIVSDKAPCDMKYVQWYALTYFGVARENRMKFTLMAAGFVNLLIKLKKQSKIMLKSKGIGKLQWWLGCLKTSLRLIQKQKRGMNRLALASSTQRFLKTKCI